MASWIERELMKTIWIRHTLLYLEPTAVRQSKVRWRNIQTIRQVLDDPIELLRMVNVLMQDPVRAKYPCASLYDAMMHLFNLRQQGNEHLTDYVKRFKQSCDVLKSHVGSKWCEPVMEHTDEYQKETNRTQQTELKYQSFERYMASVLMRNNDQAKY